MSAYFWNKIAASSGSFYPIFVAQFCIDNQKIIKVARLAPAITKALHFETKI